jgi:hypothetical protein
MSACLPYFPLIDARFYNAIENNLTEKEKDELDYEYTMFLQTWGSTALGLDEFGGQMIMSAYTTVIGDKYSGWCGIFFGNTLAYIIKNPNEKFREDIYNHDMKAVREKDVYKENNNE